MCRRLPRRVWACSWVPVGADWGLLAASFRAAVSEIEATKCKGLIRQARRWGLTRRGWVVVGLLVLTAAVLLMSGIHPFLAVNAPVRADILVVEGWVADYAVEAAAQEFARGGYSRLYVTGGSIERGAPLSEYKNYAALGAAVVNQFGVPDHQVQAVPSPDVRRDRTYASALALRKWLEARGGIPRALNVVTTGTHARRTRLMYQEAFGDAAEIGVISVVDEGYDPNRWWAYSQGVRSVMSETAAYIYARLFFRVSADRREENETGEDPKKSSP